MASIQKRTQKNGETSYRVQVRLKGYEVQRATFSRLTDARRWAQSTEAAIKEGRHFKTSAAKKYTVSDIIERYSKQIKQDNPKRFKDVKHILKWWDNEIGFRTLSDMDRKLLSSKLDELSQKSVERWNVKDSAKRPQNVSTATVNRYAAVLSHVCTVAVNEWELLESNPFQKIKKRKEPRGRTRFLSDEERKVLLAICYESHYKPLYLIVVLALSTGARKSEIMNLEWTNIDMERARIVLYETKNGECRALPLTGHAYELMQEHMKVRRLDTNLVFPSLKGDKPYEIKKSWEGALKKANINDFRFHDLRHSAASYLAMNGATLAEIAEILGHKTLAMVKRYAHLSEQHTAGVVAAMNNRIFG